MVKENCLKKCDNFFIKIKPLDEENINNKNMVKENENEASKNINIEEQKETKVNEIPNNFKNIY